MNIGATPKRRSPQKWSAVDQVRRELLGDTVVGMGRQCPSPRRPAVYRNEPDRQESEERRRLCERIGMCQVNEQLPTPGKADERGGNRDPNEHLSHGPASHWCQEYNPPRQVPGL